MYCAATLLLFNAIVLATALKSGQISDGCVGKLKDEEDDTCTTTFSEIGCVLETVCGIVGKLMFCFKMILVIVLILVMFLILYNIYIYIYMYQTQVVIHSCCCCNNIYFKI